MGARIWIVGTGNIGCLIAHALRRARQAVGLVFRNEKRLDEFARNGGKITVSGVASHGYAVLVPGAPSEPLSRVVVATKAHHTAEALQALRIQPGAEILLVQNGAGVYETLRQNLVAPRLALGIASHGVNSAGLAPFHFAHVGLGSVTMGCPPEFQASEMLFRDLERTGLPLNAVLRPWPEFAAAQMEKLCLNAAINPLTALHGVCNGEILKRRSLWDASCDILEEARLVTVRHLDNQALRSVSRLYSRHNMQQSLHDICTATSENISSMLQDVRAGRPLEIGYINGYVIGLGQQMQLPTPHNSAIVQALARQHEV